MKRLALGSIGLPLTLGLILTACGAAGGGQTGSFGTDTASGTSDPDTDTPTTGVSDSDTDTGSDSGDTGGADDGEIVECGELPPTSATCEVTSPGSAGYILRGNVLAPDTVYRGGSVFVGAGGAIACVECDCSDVQGFESATVITCPNAAISPGLINSHEHLGGAANPPVNAPNNERYEHRHDWREGLDGHTELSYNFGTSNIVKAGHELRFLMSGATSIAGADGGSQGLTRNVDESNLLEGLPINAADSDTFPLGDASGTKRDQGCDYGSIVESGEIAGSAYLPHISEGIDQAARNEFTCLSVGQFDVVAPNTSIIHAIGILPQDIKLIADDTARVIWSPRSNVALYGNTAPVTLMDSMGVPIALGTDWVVSGSMNFLRELECANYLNQNHFQGHFSHADLWRMVTTNAAFATGTESAIGMLKPGYLADISIFAGEGKVDHEAVVTAELADVALVMRGGNVLYGDDGLLSAVGKGSCESLDVCGAPKRACVAEDVDGESLQTVRAAIEEHYPLFFCEAPAGEPSCVPYRPEYPEGITMTDADGDGLSDQLDNCVNTFNPVREFEQAQGDADGDMQGDACDPCPLDPGDSCAILSANDVDGDGEPNGSDNCPSEPNVDQADGDNDGKGDACDACPIANPGASGCPVSLAAIRNPNDPNHPPQGASVSVSNVYVTAVRSGQGTRGFYVQEDSLEPWTGIFVFTGGEMANVEVGNRVTVSGTYEEYNDLSEITGAAWTIDDGGTTLPFSPIVFADPSELRAPGTAEQYESMLVEVNNVTITTQNADGQEDYDEFEVTGGLRVDDGVSDNEVDAGLDNNCPVGSNFSSIVAIEGWSFGNYKLQPRDENDVAGDCNPFQ